MSMQRMFAVQCDTSGCYEVYDGAEWYASMAYKVAIQDGWKVSGNLAICPECQEHGITFKDLRAAL